MWLQGTALPQSKIESEIKREREREGERGHREINESQTL